MTAATSGAEDASSLQTAASDVMAEGEAAAAEASGTLKQQGRHIRDEAKGEIQRFTDQRKQEAASLLTDLSNALREVTSKLDEQGHERIARYTGVAAERLSEVGNDLPARDLGELLRQVEHFARERPGMFVGALFMAGFGAARFLRASGEASAAEGGLSERTGGDYADYPEEREAYDAV